MVYLTYRCVVGLFPIRPRNAFVPQRRRVGAAKPASHGQGQYLVARRRRRRRSEGDHQVGQAVRRVGRPAGCHQVGDGQGGRSGFVLCLLAVLM